ncbi:hypothetical protein CIHG_06346 [Coccidioides immitis H538.4]|uniref:Uncharacterized protein n=1 Tax=Coccidioides immitis H538.4 TaxID=396776 RepID=A0A0J8RVF3_COCIT|nr:hypothetical protein CIHG_06346 [Coccidioides immitis H538.4]
MEHHRTDHHRFSWTVGGYDWLKLVDDIVNPTRCTEYRSSVFLEPTSIPKAPAMQRRPRNASRGRPILLMAGVFGTWTRGLMLLEHMKEAPPWPPSVMISAHWLSVSVPATKSILTNPLKPRWHSRPGCIANVLDFLLQIMIFFFCWSFYQSTPRTAPLEIKTRSY